MKSLEEFIQESSLGNIDFIKKKLYDYLNRYNASKDSKWSKDILKDIEQNIIKILPIGSIITWENHFAEHIEPIIWKIDGKNWRQDLVPSKLANWNISNKNIEIIYGENKDNNMTNEEIKDAAASTTYYNSLKKYLSMAKSKSTKEFVQQCIDDLKHNRKLE